MKKILSLSVIAIISITSYAQLKLGVQAGASFATTNFASVTLADAKGITFVQPGLVFDYSIGNKFSIKPSINYLQTGFIQDILVGGISSTNKLTINNLRIPVDLTVPIKAGPGRLLLSAGPTLNLALNGNTATTIAGGTPINTSVKFGNNVGELKSINWGTQFGIGYALNNGLELRGLYSLPITDEQNQAAGATNSTKTSVISAVLGYYFIRPRN